MQKWKVARNALVLLGILIVVVGFGVDSSPAAPDHTKFMVFPDEKWFCRAYHVEVGKDEEDEILEHCGGALSEDVRRRLNIYFGLARDQIITLKELGGWSEGASAILLAFKIRLDALSSLDHRPGLIDRRRRRSAPPGGARMVLYYSAYPMPAIVEIFGRLVFGRFLNLFLVATVRFLSQARYDVRIETHPAPDPHAWEPTVARQRQHRVRTNAERRRQFGGRQELCRDWGLTGFVHGRTPFSVQVTVVR